MSVFVEVVLPEELENLFAGDDPALSHLLERVLQEEGEVLFGQFAVLVRVVPLENTTQASVNDLI